jgi:hypothetical protein
MYKHHETNDFFFLLVASLSDRALLDNTSAVMLCLSLRDKKQTKSDTQKPRRNKNYVHFLFRVFLSLSDMLLANRIYANGNLPFFLAWFS